MARANTCLEDRINDRDITARYSNAKSCMGWECFGSTLKECCVYAPFIEF